MDRFGELGETEMATVAGGNADSWMDLAFDQIRNAPHSDTGADTLTP